PDPDITYSDSQVGDIITRSWTATDESGNSSSCDQLITIVCQSECPSVVIEKTHNSIQGFFEQVSLYVNAPQEMPMMAGFSFLLEYDASALSFVKAAPGKLLRDCDWEFFTYRFGQGSNCGGTACPSGMLRVVAMAEDNNGPGHPSCHLDGSEASGDLVDLTFLVSNDRTLECQYVPIRFSWYDCGDNTLSSIGGDTLYISQHVYDYGNTLPVENPGAAFPSLLGAAYQCDVSDKGAPVRCLDFYNGGIDIVCADSIDLRGDINVNGIANEIADVVAFTDYFLNGLTAFGNHIDASVAASDVNADGVPLTVADLVALIRIVVGDSQPYPKSGPQCITFTNQDGALWVSDPVGAAYLVYAGDVTPDLLADGMDMKYRFDGERTHILLYSLSAGQHFKGTFLNVTGDIVSVVFATYDGAPVQVMTLPAEFELGQNYPNPANPTTQISFDLHVAADVELEIFNVVGQRVVSLVDRYLEAGRHTVVWDGRNADGAPVASGVYLYRLHAGNRVSTRKMMLLK
ncbi:T9SS type A sorting domain-containing protein, partial [bacterium]|nr:T9SS type A sorting domain-containing protein [bacterium]